MDENKTAAEEVQTSLFSPPTKEETIESIKRRFNDFAEVQNGSEYCIADMQQSLDRLYNTIADGGTPEQIAAACNTAAAKMEAIADKENDNALKGIAQAISMFADKVCPNMQRPKSHVFHGEKCFILPDEIEEYRKVNPVGAAAHEKQEVQEAKREAAIKLSFNADGAKSIEDMTPEELKAAVAEYTREQDKVRKIITEYANSIAGKGVDNIVAGVTEALQQAKVPLTDLTYNILSFMQSETMEQFSSMLSTLSKWYGDISAQFEAGDFSFLSAYFENIDDITPLLKGQLEKYKKDHGIENLTLSEFLRNIDPETGNPVESIFAQCVNAITKNTIPTVTAKKADFIEFPIDKVNATIWGLLESDTGGQLAIKAEKAGSKKEINIMYSIDFDELDKAGITITKRLTPFDKRVYIAISSLFNAGNNVISLSQIYYLIGGIKRPNATDIKKINDAVTKMRSASIYVNNEQEAASYKYPHFKYDGYLLPIERITASVNGKVSEAAIHIFREPPVMTFAKDRKQVTTISKKLLQSPVSKTDANIAIDDYLIERISHAKKGTQPKRILWETICENTGNTEKKQKQRLKEKVNRYMEHYKTCGFISSFSTDDKGIIFTL